MYLRICTKGDDKVFLLSLNFNAVKINHKDSFIHSNNSASIGWAASYQLVLGMKIQTRKITDS